MPVTGIGDSGQAAVELLASLPLLALLVLAACQAGDAVRLAVAAESAARAGARAHAVGADAMRAVRSSLPGDLAATAVITDEGGRIAVELPVRVLFGGPRIGTLGGSSRFEGGQR